MKATRMLRAFIQDRRRNGHDAAAAIRDRFGRLGQEEGKRMKATDLLKAQHREVLAMLERMEDMRDSRQLRQSFEGIAAKLAGHDKIEREIFYPACQGVVDDEVLQEARSEHGVLAFSLILADNVKGGDASFKARVKMVREIVQKHVKEEEREMLPEAERGLGAEQLEDLGDEMSMMFEEALEEPYRPALDQVLGMIMREGGGRGGARKAAGRKAVGRKATARKAARRGTARRGRATGSGRSRTTVVRGRRTTTARGGSTTRRGGATRRSSSGSRKKSSRAGSRKSR